MASLGFWSPRDMCATNAGAILFAIEPLNWFPGASIQYVHYEGSGLDSEVIDERRFVGDLISVLREVDGFLRTMLPSQPEAVTVLTERRRISYPSIAIREILMNAVMHRDYESNAAVRFYQFCDRIEVQNPGGLYGSVTQESFPFQNDYRNPKIAEAMKTLGYVNTFGRGIARAQAALKENGNPPAEFDISQNTFFLATLRGIQP